MTTLNVNLSAELQNTLGQSGVWAYAVYFSGGTPQFTTLVENGVVQSSGPLPITLPDPFANGKVYFLVQSQDPSQPNDLASLITGESDINWNNASAWDFRYDSFEVTLQNSSTDDGNLTSVNGFGLPMQVSVTYSDSTTSTVGYNITGAEVFQQIGQIDSAAVYNFSDGPLAGTPRAAVSPSQAVSNSPILPGFEASDWNGYIASLKVADPGVEVAGFFDGAEDADGVWHDAGFFSYALEWDNTNEVFWLSAAENSEIQGYIQITPDDLANSIYSTLGNVGIYATKDGEPYQILDHPSLGGNYSMNTGENNQWGEVLTQFLTGFTAGFYGTTGAPINPLASSSVDLNKNWNWDPSYAFGANLSSLPALFQDPYSEIFFLNSNSYGSGYADNLMRQYAVGGPLIPVSEPGQSQNVSAIDITIYDDDETPGGYETPVIYNYIQPVAFPGAATSGNTVKLNFANGDMVLSDDTPISLDLYLGLQNPGELLWETVEFNVPEGQSPWQAWQLTEGTDGSYAASLEDGTPQGAGQLLITNFPTPSADGVYWYRLNVGEGATRKSFNLYVTTSGSAFLNPNYAGQEGSLAVDGLATISPQSSADETIPTFTVNFLYAGIVAVDPDLLVRVPSETENSGTPNAPIAGTLSGDEFDALPHQSSQVANTIKTQHANIAFGWTGLNDNANTQCWISGYTNKVGGLNFAEINIVQDGTVVSSISAQADVDGQWQTTTQPLSNGRYTITMSEYLWSDPTLTTQVGETSSALILKVRAQEMDLAAGADGEALKLVSGGAGDPAGNWIKLKALESSAPSGTTLLLYAVNEDGELVSRDGLEAGVALEDAILATIGAVHSDSGGLLLRGAQSVYLPTGLQLRFAVLGGDDVIDADPNVKIVEQQDGLLRVKVAGFVLRAETDNSLSGKALLAGTQRSTDEPMLYLEHGATLDIEVAGSSGNKNTLGFVKIDVDAATGDWSVGGVAYGDTEAFTDAVLTHLDDGFHFKRGGNFTATRSWTVDGETGYYAPVLLTEDGDTFVIGNANPGGEEYIRMFGQNTFAFEDTTEEDGSDFDYNDMVMRISPSTAAHLNDPDASWHW